MTKIKTGILKYIKYKPTCVISLKCHLHFSENIAGFGNEY